MSEAFKGVTAVVLACMVWGISPLFYKLIAHVPPLEVFSHRILWSFVLFFTWLALRGRVGRIRELLRPGPDLWRVLGSALMVTANWSLFIWAVQFDRVTETSLGYFIQPLVAVLFGYWLYAERPARLQWVAVGLAGLAVAILTLRLGVLPWLSLVLGITFAFYGALKKRQRAGAITSVTVEAMLVLPFAAVWLVGAHAFGWTLVEGRDAGVFGQDLSDSLLLIVSGLLTAGPLVLISYGAQRIRLSTTGVVQYLNPMLQFICAVFIFAEPFTSAHMVAFALIWLGLALYSWSEFRRAA